MNDLTKVLVKWSSILHRFSAYGFNRFTRSEGLSVGQMNVLLHLHHKKACEVTNFCEILQITPAGASQMIERMVQAGVVQRAEGPKDRRVRMVSLTKRGMEIVQANMAAREVGFKRISETLTPEEYKKVVEGLEILNHRAMELESRILTTGDSSEAGAFTPLQGSVE